MVFGGSVLWNSPLVAVLLLNDLRATPLEYGLVLGLPCAGGLLGAWLAPRITQRLGERRCLLTFGVCRTVWLAPMPILHSGSRAIVVIGACNFGLLLSAGIFNPVFTSYRLRLTPDAVMARVGTAWAISAKSAQPVFVGIGGAVAAWSSPRLSLLVAGIVCLCSAIVLPWRA